MTAHSLENVEFVPRSEKKAVISKRGSSVCSSTVGAGEETEGMFALRTTNSLFVDKSEMAGGWIGAEGAVLELK